MNVNFRLRQNSIQIDINGNQLSKRIQVSIGIKIEAKNWDTSKGCINLKSYQASEKIQAKKIQDRLDYIKSEFIHQAVTLRQGKHLPYDEAKSLLSAILGEKINKSELVNLKSVVEAYIASKKLSANTKKGLIISVRAFGESALINDITSQKIANFIKSSKLAEGSKKLVLINLKTLLRFASKQGHKVSESALKATFKLKSSKKTDYTALSLNDIKLLESLDLPRKLAESRDWFVFACLHGQRFSDWHRLAQSDDFYQLIQTKTKKIIQIPRFTKLDHYFEKTQSLTLKHNINVNKHLKEISIIFNEAYKKSINLDCHTARVSFISIALNELNFSFEEARAISGHEKSTMLLHYNQQSKAKTLMSVKTKLQAI